MCVLQDTPGSSILLNVQAASDVTFAGRLRARGRRNLVWLRMYNENEMGEHEEDLTCNYLKALEGVWTTKR
jgi:hypothetical protein